MTRNATWDNDDGLSVGFGTRDSINPNAATVRTEGNVEVLQFPLHFESLPVSGVAPSTKSIPIPGRSVIQRATLTVTEAWVGGTSIGIGTMLAAGTAIDVDGIDVAIATAAINVIGEVVQCNGAQVGLLIDVGAADAFISTSVVGTYTAGSAILLVEYVLPMPDADALDPITTIVGSL